MLLSLQKGALLFFGKYLVIHNYTPDQKTSRGVERLSRCPGAGEQSGALPRAAERVCGCQSNVLTMENTVLLVILMFLFFSSTKPLYYYHRFDYVSGSQSK